MAISRNDRGYGISKYGIELQHTLGGFVSSVSGGDAMADVVTEKLGGDWLDNGRLVRLSPRQVPSPNHHFICWKNGTLERWECAAFVDWLRLALS